MRICGFDIGGSDVAISVVTFLEDHLTVEHVGVRRYSLPDDRDQGAVKDLQQTINALVRENNIDVLAIRSRHKKGKMAGGAVSFKIEGLIQLADCDVCIFITPQAISKQRIKAEIPPGSSLMRYQEEAFFLCLAAREKL